MSSPNHFTSDIEDAFSSMNILNYTSVSSYYFPVSAWKLVLLLFRKMLIDKMYLKHHEEQIEDILNYLEELSFHRIEKMEEGRIDRMIIRRNSDELKTNSRKSYSIINFSKDSRASQKTSSSENTSHNFGCHQQLLMIGISSALKAQAASMANKYCPRTEVKKMEDKFYNLVVKGNDLKTYIRRFQELAVLCPNMVPNAEKLMEVFINGLPRSIEGNVTASKPQTLEEAINIAQRLMDQIIKHDYVQEANDRKRKLEDVQDE
ncbi:reverse transcriptase domain-containing protein [Tanacetum coccineum]